MAKKPRPSATARNAAAIAAGSGSRATDTTAIRTAAEAPRTRRSSSRMAGPSSRATATPATSATSKGSSGSKGSERASVVVPMLVAPRAAASASAARPATATASASTPP